MEYPINVIKGGRVLYPSSQAKIVTVSPSISLNYGNVNEIDDNTSTV